MINMKMVKKILGISLFLSTLLTGCTLPQLSEIDADTYEGNYMRTVNIGA